MPRLWFDRFWLLSARIGMCWAVLLFAILVHISAVHAAERVVLQLAWKHQFQFAGYYAARDQGFYRYAGLEVQIVEGGNGKFAREEVLNGRAQYGIAGAELILHRAEGDPFVVLAPIFQHSPSILLVRKDSGISNLQDLIGKSVMLLPGKNDTDILAAFSNEGVGPDSFKRLNRSYNLNDLIEGRTDAVSAYLTNEPWLLRQQGVEPKILSPQTYGVDFYSDCLFTTETEINKNSQRVEKFLNASIRGWEYAMAHPSQIIDTLLASYGLKKSRAHLQYEADTIRKIMLPDLVQIGHMNPGRWQHIAAIYTTLEMLKPDFRMEGFLYSLHSEVDYARIKRTLAVAFGICVVFSLGTLVLIRFYRKLASEVVQRRKAQQALEASEQRYRSVSELTSDYAYAYRVEPGPELESEWVTGAFTRVTGYSYREIQSLGGWEHLIHHEDLHVCYKQLKALLANQRKTVDYRIHTKTGQVCWMRDTARPIWDADQKRVVRIEGAVQDISESRQNYLALKESEAKYRSIFENFVVGFFETRPDGRYVRVNPAFVRMLGYDSPEDLIDTVTDIATQVFVDPEVRQDTLEILKSEGHVENYTFQARRKDGSLIWLSNSARAYFDSSGNLTHCEGIAFDITKRIQAENALRDMNETMALAQKMAGIGYWRFDPATSKRSWSRQMFTVFGFGQRQEPPNNSELEQRWHPQDWRLYRESFQQALQGKPYNIVARINFPDGSQHTVETQGYPRYDNQGRVLGLYGTSQDVTEKAVLEKQLVQAHKMESVGRLAGGVAHDFNNMLNVILGRTEILLMESEADTSQHENLEEILKAAQRSADLTRQLLAFARKQTISPKILDLNETVEGMLKMLRRIIGEDIDLIWQPESRLWSVKMDPVQVDQILANLCVNARDAIAGTGKVTIETGNIELDETYCETHPEIVPGAYILLGVSDSGSGMDKKTLENLFDPFFTTKEVGEGTGLGLSTVYGIVKQNGGAITVYSEPGHGSTFKIYLPRTAETEKVPQKNDPATIPGGTETVLVVEDEESILKLGRALLERFGYTVITACTPGEALARVGKYTEPIHLLITDVVMPEMNGKALAQRIQDIKPDIKIIFMSGYTSNVILHRGILEENVNFLQKPFTAKTLMSRVRHVLDS